ncbi:MAG: hypothetical protein JSV53_03380 [candidate division WOR-3 bacterium]|nr:MAG: hypothetical protein JSV53_03380 [candidate division WOR-3 bacterium]
MLLVQLWSQPSVRMLGFGRYFAGYVPDPITDLTWNPAYMKTLGENVDTYNTPQIYAMTRIFTTNELTNQTPNMEFWENDELMSLFALYPKIGVALRLGAWQRSDVRSYYTPELWAYGQAGILGSLGITQRIKVGVEYSASWNNKPDWIYLEKHDTLGIIQDAVLTHSEWSDQIGLGIILTDNMNWEISLSGRSNWETNSFIADTIEWFWPQHETVQFDEQYNDMQVNARLRLLFRKLKVTLDWKYAYKDCRARNSMRPGLGITYYPMSNIFVIGGLTYVVNKSSQGGTSWIRERRLIGLAGFEARFSPILTFRIGNTTTYTYYHEIYHQLTNEISFGIDLIPYEKLKLNFATSNPFEYSCWYFGVSFAL